MVNIKFSQDIKNKTKNKLKKQEEGKIMYGTVGDDYYFFGKVCIREEVDRERINNFINEMNTEFLDTRILNYYGDYYYVLGKLKNSRKRRSDIDRDFKSVFTSKGNSTCIHHKNHSAVEIRPGRSLKGVTGTVLGTGLSVEGSEKLKLYCTECAEWKYKEKVLNHVIKRIKNKIN